MGVGRQNVEAIEAGVDTAMDQTKEAVPQLGNQVQEAVDHTVNRLEWSWEKQRPKIEAYMATHPWVVLGGLVLAGYLIG